MLLRYFHSAGFMALVAAMVFSMRANAGVMNWQLDSNDTSDGSAQSAISKYYNDYGVTLSHARLIAVAPEDYDGDKYTALERVVGNTSTGKTTYDLASVFGTTGVVSDLGSYAGTGWAYFVELGYFSGDNYELAARSASVKYENVASYISAGSILPTTGMYAFGSFTVVPEPASAILMMIGIGLLGLRRKRV